MADLNSTIVRGKLRVTEDINANGNITTNGTLYLTKATDLSGTANNHPALIVGGTDTTAHLEIDANEIHAKASGTTVAPLYLNHEGGYTCLSGEKTYSDGTYLYSNSTKVSVVGHTHEVSDITDLYKQEYNLGYYDTITENSDGTYTITRQTGYVILDGSEDGWGIYLQGLWAYIKVYNIIPVTNQNNVGQFITNRGPAVSITTMINTSSGIQIAQDELSINIRPNVSSINSLETFKQWLAQNNIAIQYKLATSYTEKVEKNHYARYNEHFILEHNKSEAEKSANLFDVNNVEYGSIDENGSNMESGHARVRSFYIPVLPNTYYSISANNPSLLIYELYQYDSNKSYIAPYVDILEDTYTFLTKNNTYYIRILFRNTSNTDFNLDILSRVMLNYGTTPLPYQPYEGKVVHEKGLEDKLGGYASSGHTHDDRYYTESEVDTKLNGKSNTGHTHQALDILCSIGGSNTNTYPYRRLMSIPATTNSYVDISGTYYLHGYYQDAPWYIFRVEFRTNNSSAGQPSYARIQVIATNRKADDLIGGLYSVVTNGVTTAYLDVYYKLSDLFGRIGLSYLGVKPYGGWTYHNSSESKDSTLPTNAYKTLEGNTNDAASYAIHGIEKYTRIVYGSLVGKVDKSTYLLSPATSRLTNANIDHSVGQKDGKGQLRLDLSTSSMTSNKPSATGFIYTNIWDYENYNTQLFIPNGLNMVNGVRPSLRGCNNGTWQTTWKELAYYSDLDNYTKKTITIPDNTSLDTVTESGFYRLSMNPNFPHAQMIVSRGADTIAQMAFPYDTTRMYVRTGNPFNTSGGLWHDWKEVSLEGHTHSQYLTSHQNEYGKISDGTNTTTANAVQDTITFSITTGSTAGVKVNGDTVTITQTDTDTKNTAGSSNNENKLFLIGATSQTGSTQTYSNQKVYTQSKGVYANAFYAASDRRLKENIKDLDLNCLDLVNNINLREFSWKTDETHKPVIGAIAQELKKVLPEKYAHEFIGGQETDDEYLSINDSKLVYLLIGAIQEQQKEIESLKAKIDSKTV